MSCPNKNLKEYQQLVSAYGEGRALASWILNNEQIPTLEEAATLLEQQSPSTVNSSLKIIEALGTDKVQQLYNKFYKNNPEKFYNELTPLAGKQQVEILKDYNSKNSPTSLQDMLTGIMTEMSYTVEVNTAMVKGISELKDMRGRDAVEFTYNGVNYDAFEGRDEEDGSFITIYTKYVDGKSKEISHKEFSDALESAKNIAEDVEKPTQYYSNLTVPGGTNYTENEISTPSITPSIKGHAQFSTSSGIGWFRSDDSINKDIDSAVDTLKASGRLKIIC